MKYAIAVMIGLQPFIWLSLYAYEVTYGLPGLPFAETSDKQEGRVAAFDTSVEHVDETAKFRQVPQLTIPCEVVEVYDGGTLTVRVTMDVRVRLLDCWTPEIRTKNRVEKQQGIHARETLRKLVRNEQCLLSVPLDGADRLDDVFTFGRLLGRIWLVESKLDVSEEMVRMGVADEVKP